MSEEYFKMIRKILIQERLIIPKPSFRSKIKCFFGNHVWFDKPEQLESMRMFLKLFRKLSVVDATRHNTLTWQWSTANRKTKTICALCKKVKQNE